MKSDRDILIQIYEDKQKELMMSRIQNWLYLREYADPQKMGKSQAEEGAATYQKNMKYLEEQLVAIKGFAETLKLTLE